MWVRSPFELKFAALAYVAELSWCINLDILSSTLLGFNVVSGLILGLIFVWFDRRFDDK